MREDIEISCELDCACHQHTLRLTQLAGIPLTEAMDYDLKTKYAAFNKQLFKGELPDIPITFASLKNVGGRVTYQIRREAGVTPPNPLMVRFGQADKYQGAQIVPGTLKMQISNVYQRSEVALDAILLHEMIHVYFAAIGKYGENHGINFQRMAAEISKKVGFTVPMKDSVDGLDLVSMDTKPIGVIVVQRGNNYSFAITSDKLVQAKLEEIKQRWTPMVQGGYPTKVGIWIVNTMAWTRVAHELPLQRNLANYKTQFYKLTDQILMDDLAKEGRQLWEMTAPNKP